MKAISAKPSNFRCRPRRGVSLPEPAPALPRRGAFKGRTVKALSRRGARPPANRWQLRLYVTGQTTQSITALHNLKEFCDRHLCGRYRITVIDLVERPQLAKGDQILAIPTVVRQLPKPVRIIIGNLSNHEPLLVGLDLRPVV